MAQITLKHIGRLRKMLHIQGARVFWLRGHTVLYAEQTKNECNAVDGLFTELSKSCC